MHRAKSPTQPTQHSTTQRTRQPDDTAHHNTTQHHRKHHNTPERRMAQALEETSRKTAGHSSVPTASTQPAPNGDGKRQPYNTIQQHTKQNGTRTPAQHNTEKRPQTRNRHKNAHTRPQHHTTRHGTPQNTKSSRRGGGRQHQRTTHAPHKARRRKEKLSQAVPRARAPRSGN